MMNIEYIEKNEYEKLVSDVLFPENETSRVYGKIKIGDKPYKLAWSSDMIKPKVNILNEKFLFIGIDNHIAVVEITPSRVILNKELQWNFFDVSNIFGVKFYVTTELSVLIFDSLDFSLIKEKVLPDIISDYEFSDNSISVECMDGNSYEIR